MVKSFVKTSDKRMKLVYKKVIEPQLGNLISILKKKVSFQNWRID